MLAYSLRHYGKLCIQICWKNSWFIIHSFFISSQVKLLYARLAIHWSETYAVRWLGWNTCHTTPGIYEQINIWKVRCRKHVKQISLVEFTIFLTLFYIALLQSEWWLMLVYASGYTFPWEGKCAWVDRHCTYTILKGTFSHFAFILREWQYGHPVASVYYTSRHSRQPPWVIWKTWFLSLKTRNPLNLMRTSFMVIH